VRTTRLWNNHHLAHSKSKGWKTKYIIWPWKICRISTGAISCTF